MLNPFHLVRYVKSDPSTYLIQYRGGRIACQGRGLAFFYFAPRTTLVAVPLASVDLPFMFAEATADFQEITVQGRVVYRVADPERLSGLMNFALDAKGRGYLSEDPDKLDGRVLHQVQVMLRAELEPLVLAAALAAGSRLTEAVGQRLRGSVPLAALGIEVMDIATLAVRPTPETARALGAEMREQVLQSADEAVYRRRNAAVDQERAIKENELQTEQAVAERRRSLEQENLEGQIRLEHRRSALVETSTANSREEADARAYAVRAVLEALARVDPRVLEAVAATGMKPEQLIARSFQGIAQRADKIGELNISPDLLGSLLGRA
jgi:regulator of protease activity HflC (stomatin/prohibitin superfamily)